MALGAAAPGASASLRAVHKIGSRGRDGTRYSRFHASNFLSHHLAKIVAAAVYSDAQHIEEGVYGLKTRAHDLSRPTPPLAPPKRFAPARARTSPPPACHQRVCRVCSVLPRRLRRATIV